MATGHSIQSPITLLEETDEAGLSEMLGGMLITGMQSLYDREIAQLTEAELGPFAALLSQFGVYV